MSIRVFVYEKYPKANYDWYFSGVKYSWNLRIKDKNRAILYMLPREVFFEVAFVFGQKTTDKLLKSDSCDEIKTELRNARVYGEGRGIRIDIINNSKIKDIKKLVDIKLGK